MAEIYVSASGSATAPYETWAKAQTNLETAIVTNAASGDIIIVDSTYTLGASTTIDLDRADTPGTPVRVISVDKTGDPAGIANQTYQAGALIDNSSGSIFLSEIEVEFYGVNFQTGSDFRYHNNGSIAMFDGIVRITGSSGLVYFNDCTTYLNNVRFWFEDAGTKVTVRNGGYHILQGCALHASSAAITDFLTIDAFSGGSFRVDGFDLTPAASGTAFLTSIGTAMQNSHLVALELSGIELPPTSDVVSATFNSQSGYVMSTNSGNGTTTSKFHYEDRRGVVTESTSSYLGGEDVNGTNWSYQAVSSAAMLPGGRPLRWLVGCIAGDASQSVTVNLTSATLLTNQEFWIEVLYPESGTAKRILVSSADGEFIAGVGTLLSSGPSWTSGGQTNNYSVTLACPGGQTGVYQVFACLAEPSVTVYIDPKITLG